MDHITELVYKIKEKIMKSYY